MFWPLILKPLTLVECLLDYFVNLTVLWTKAADGQWSLVYLNSIQTEKGQAVVGDIATIIHTGLDFVAQFMTLLPAPDGIPMNAAAPITNIVPNP
jgi:hypothetical protein